MIGTLSIATSAAIAGGIAGVAASVALSAFAPKPKAPDISSLLGQAGANRTFQFRQPTPPHNVVLGRVKVSGPVMFMHSMPDDTGREDGYFFEQLALAAHSCHKIDTVYVNELFETNSKFDGLLRFGRNLGAADQVEDADFLADIGEELFGNHWLRGVTNLCGRLKGNAAAFPSGLPNLSAIVWGANEIYDPRTGTTGFTNNAALCYAWWKTWARGMKVDYEDIDEDTLIDSANTADERVRVRTTTSTFAANPTLNVLVLTPTARSLDVGDGVRVASSLSLPGGLAVDTTYYAIPQGDGTLALAASVADAFAETAIDLTTAGTGTLTLTYWDEARYKINGTFTLDQDKDQIKQQLLSAMIGDDFEVGGKWFICAGAPAIATMTLDEDDLRADMTWSPKRSMRDKFNGLRARFVNPDNYWQPSDAPPLSDADYVAEDNGIELFQEISFPFTTSGRAVQRMMRALLEQNRRQRTVNFPAMYTCMPLRPLSGVYLTNARNAWDQEQHLVTSWKLTEDMGVNLVMRDDGPEVWDWDAETDEQIPAAPQSVTLPDGTAIPAPETVTVETPTTPTYTHLAISWDAVASAWLSGYDVEYRDDGGSAWTSYGRVAIGSPLTASIERTSPQDFRVRAASTIVGVGSDYTTNLAPDAPSGLAVGAGPSVHIVWTSGADAEDVQIFEGDTAVFADSTLLETVPSADEDHAATNGKNYWIRSVNADGNISAEVGPVSPEGGGD